MGASENGARAGAVLQSSLGLGAVSEPHAPVPGALPPPHLTGGKAFNPSPNAFVAPAAKPWEIISAAKADATRRGADVAKARADAIAGISLFGPMELAHSGALAKIRELVGISRDPSQPAKTREMAGNGARFLTRQINQSQGLTYSANDIQAESNPLLARLDGERLPPAPGAVHEMGSERAQTDAAENAAAEDTRLRFSRGGKPVALTPLPVISSSTNALPVVQEKQQVRASGYSKEAVNGLIDKFYKPEAYESLRGTNPIFLVAPTTSGKNVIPADFAKRLQKEFGGEVVFEKDYAAARSKEQAKDRKGYLQKLANPSRFTIQPGLAERIGNRPVVIVDDILTSGETLDGLQMDLQAAGVQVQSVATLVAHDAGRAVGDASLQALARKISRLTGGTSVNRILEDLRLAHGHSRAKLIQNADDDVRDHQTGRDALEHIRGQAEAVRSALREGEQRGSPRTQLRAGGVSEGRGVLHGVPPLEAGRENAPENNGASGRPGRLANNDADLAGVIADGSRFLNRQLPGLIHEKTHIFSSAEELLNSDYAKQHPFTEEERAAIASAEGFFDKSTNATVIIAGNIALRKGESASQAFARVVIHERIGHEGINLLLGSNERFKQRWEALMARIPKTELEAIAAEEGYQNLANKPHDLALEWLARRTESDPTLLKKPGVVREMWEAFKEWVSGIFKAGDLTDLSESDFDAEVHSLLHEARGAAVKHKSPSTPHSSSRDKGLQLSAPQENTTPSNPHPQGAAIDNDTAREQVNLTEQATKNHLAFDALRTLTNTASPFNLLGGRGEAGGSSQTLDNVRSGGNRSADETQPGVASRERTEDSRRREELERLAEWAKHNAATFDAARLGRKHDDGGEHTIYRSNEDSGRFFKVTHPGTAGLSLQTKQGKEGPIVGQGRGSVRDYLVRLILANVVLRDDLRLEGVLTQGEPSLVISQPIREGSHPEPKDVNGFLKSLGFERVDTYMWYRSTDGIVLGDTKPWNFLTPDEGKTILPIDVSIRFATPAMTEAWGHLPPPNSPLRRWVEEQLHRTEHP